MEDKEEARLEVEAVQAVYGDDCCVIDEFPPHLTVHIVPRTAEDSSQQVFVQFLRFIVRKKNVVCASFLSSSPENYHLFSSVG
jgi:hypothetical protein